MVMQEGYIFSDTISGNIGVTDELPRKEKVVEAAKTANIHEFIQSLPLRYNTRIGSDGHGLSTVMNADNIVTLDHVCFTDAFSER
ncbi:MAG: hypothetical protein LBR57_04565 [Alistipes sp.]|jgi:ATP-binding cassette subfamily B protein|nr:hypothetical protein [Alistipes sp.]